MKGESDRARHREIKIDIERDTKRERKRQTVGETGKEAAQPSRQILKQVCKSEHCVLGEICTYCTYWSWQLYLNSHN